MESELSIQQQINQLMSVVEYLLKKVKKRELTLNILNTKRKHVKAKKLEKIYGGSAIYNLLKKLEKVGMIEKTAYGHKLSKKFSNILRAWTEEWEEFVEE